MLAFGSSPKTFIYVHICLLTLLIISFQPIDYNGFTLFMKTYLELNEVPEELCTSLFQSFMKSGKCCNSSNNYSSDVASQTICVPLAHSSTDLLHLVGTDKADRYHGLLAEKFHDLTERIHSLGHSSGEKLYQHRKREHQHFEAINSVGILCSKTGILPSFISWLSQELLLHCMLYSQVCGLY